MSDERQFTATTQDGIPGHCFCAQVFDPDGNPIAELEPTDEPAIANQRAQWLADACNAHPADGDELALSQLIDGLRLEWERYEPGDLYRVLDNPFGVFTVRRFKDITPTGVVVGYRWDYRAYSGYELPNRPRTARGVCDSFEHGMELGVQYYKLLVRAIFKGV